MIFAIEGPSATGKTTWCQTHCPQSWVREAPYHIAAPDLYADPAEVARFWVNHNSANWQRALELERECGVAVCDGDPFHLYFGWAAWKAGALDARLFELESELYRKALEERRMGFVDRVLWMDVPADELRRRAATDRTRPRKRHKLYLRMAPWMERWYAVRERLAPGTVQPLETAVDLEASNADASAYRYSLALFDKWMSAVQGGSIFEVQ